MTTILSTTMRGRQLLELASLYEGYELWEVYGRCSKEKFMAWKECKKECEKEGGSNFHICSHNGYQFTVAWNVEKGVRIKTAKNSYLIELVD